MLTDPLLIWAADRPGARIWTNGDAIAVTCADLSRWDRIAVTGDPEPVARLLDEVVAEVGPSYRPVGDEALIAAVIEILPHLVEGARFGWMDTATPPGGSAFDWLGPDDLPSVAALLDGHHPDSYAKPGLSGVDRWAGLRVDGELLAVAADAWSSPRIGFLAGVATRTDARGRGLAAALCGAVTDEMLAGRERVALLVDHVNAAAIAVYERLGFRMRRIAAARWLSASPPSTQ